MAVETIKKNKEGTYYFRANLGYNETGKKIQKYKSGFSTKKEAREAYYKLIFDFERESISKKSIEADIFFKDFVETYFLPWYKGRVKRQTFENRLGVVKSNLPYFNTYKLSEIKAITIQNWQIEMSKSLQPSTMKIVQNFLSMIMSRAVILELIESNPVVKVGNLRIEKKEMKIWTVTEFQKVIKYFNKNNYYEHLLFVSLWVLFMTGIRIGEAGALKWDNLDFDTGRLSIQKTLVYNSKNDYRLSTPKTRASQRNIVLDDKTIQILKEWKKEQNRYVKTDFILSYNGIPINGQNMMKAINKYSKLADVHKIRVHDLRHSHASLLINLGENPLIIKERLGHCDVKTTLGTYGHLYPSAHNTVADKLAKLVSLEKVQ